MKIADNTLQALTQENTFVDVFTDYFEVSLFGFIKNFNKDFLLLEHYNEDGLYNGIIIFKRQDITRIRWDNNEINSAANIIKRKSITIENINLESIESIIKSTYKKYGYVSLQIQDLNTDWTIIGQVQEIDKDTLILKEYGTMSTLDRGMLMLSLSDITRIDADGIYENNLMKVHSKNNRR